MKLATYRSERSNAIGIVNAEAGRVFDIAAAARREGTSDASFASMLALIDAVLLATCLYWKPVLCQQRSVCVVRLLRKHGIPGRLVIGYRPAPFFAHAWAEVEGRVVN